MGRRLPRKYNPMAKALASPIYRQRVIQPRKGRRAYTRKTRHTADNTLNGGDDASITEAA
jgi:stalled ribosome alternative rescue factor ArfA